MSQSATMAAPRRCPSGVVRASLAPRPTLSLSVLYHLSQNGTTTAPVVVRGVQCCSCQSDNHPCHWSMSFVSKWDHGRPCHCLSDVVCPKMGLRPRLSLSVWCCPYHCCLSHAVCLKVGPRPPLSLSVWCRPYHSPTVVCPMQSVSKWDHDRPCRCPSGVVRIIPLFSVLCNLSQSGTTTAPVVVCLVPSLSLPCCCLSHAVCLKVGPRPPLSLSVGCCPCQTGTTTIPLVACAAP